MFLKSPLYHIVFIIFFSLFSLLLYAQLSFARFSQYFPFPFIIISLFFVSSKEFPKETKGKITSKSLSSV